MPHSSAMRSSNAIFVALVLTLAVVVVRAQHLQALCWSDTSASTVFSSTGSDVSCVNGNCTWLLQKNGLSSALIMPDFSMKSGFLYQGTCSTPMWLRYNASSFELDYEYCDNYNGAVSCSLVHLKPTFEYRCNGLLLTSCTPY